MFRNLLALMLMRSSLNRLFRLNDVGFFFTYLFFTANLKAIIGNLSDKKVSVNIQVSLNCPMTLCHRGECRGQKARG